MTICLFKFIGTFFECLCENKKFKKINMAEVIHLNEETFKEKVFNYDANQEWKYEGSVPSIIDFWAEWCRPCKMIGPILDELQQEYGDKIQVFKVNTEEQQRLAGMFGIRSIPSLLFVPIDGQPQMAVGALPKESLKQAISDVFKITE
ncbi:MAG: thioredoxin [Bacteroidales bacterium]|nr:thioredoxin [Bacteroidales bacterium]